MFLVNKRRVCVVVATLLAGLFVPLTAHADSHYGTRYDGANYNGYWLSPSILTYKATVRSAFDVWIQACSSSGNLKLIQLAQRFTGIESGPNPDNPTGYIRGDDVISVPKQFNITPSDRFALARTRMYKAGSGGVAVVDDDPPPLSNRDRNWYFCNIQVDLKGIQTVAGSNMESKLYVVMVHEIGHSLKMAHPPEGPAGQVYVPGQLNHQAGEGTFRKDKSFGNGYSIMQRTSSSATLSAYDKTELLEKWGRP